MVIKMCKLLLYFIVLVLDQIEETVETSTWIVNLKKRNLNLKNTEIE